MNSELCELQLVESSCARGFGVWSAFVRAQQLNHGAALSGASYGPSARAAKTLLAERVIEIGLPGHQLAIDLVARVRKIERRFGLRTREQRGGLAGRNEEAHELAVEPLGDVDAGDLAGLRHRRSAAHAGIDRAGEMHARVVALLDEAVVGAFDDREAEIERIAHRVEPLAARRGVGDRGRVEVEMRQVRAFELDDREIVGDVDREQLQRALRSVGPCEFEAIGLRLERVLRNDVVVRDREPIRR